MNDREFQRFLEESKARSRSNGYSYTDTPTSYELPAFSKSERKNIEAVIRSITPRDRFMSVRKTTKNNLKTFLMSFDSYEQLPSKIEDLIIGTCRSFGRDNYHRKIFYLLRSLDEINSSTVTSHLQRQATRLSHELPSDKYCANLTTICNKVIETINHHIAVGNIEPMENEQPDFEFDPYILEEF
ncbi:TPA_asm: hypothetical protein G1Y42_20205 [Salmonella enterica subsp. enterica serovar Typhi str. 404ty]|uniref:Uncharacterized protein n=1 Tax=Salmonella enterica subsp. enterica serovar Typhi str. 404ty TaxID=497977 RepID=A0A719TI63_SALTI|nr:MULTISPECIES: hypothetical protein [Enterobacteriaceae]EJB8822200.1 hypothetical protein [Escherichia coli]HAD7320087.1 hypothetical protein [Salmonella enterica subsp. enterica serovar Typhi str. 404ty]RSK72236.1 hypothetical protein D7Z29_10060 [Escherichia fergusonii]CSQ19852.1 Uncharacterised protein [Shigella sonnei]HAD7328920.1 hypothetical protein [Salmonella enterica subsp. enterica serovar Typhi str. 404ty]